jgi:hypothetical protein
VRRWRWWASWVALWLAASLFLWMFLASDGVARTVDASTSDLDAEARRRAAQFADDWRHGLVGSPLFVPGFLVTAVAVTMCDRQRSLRQLGAMGAAAIALGLGVAWVLAPEGTDYVTTAVEHDTGITVAEPFQRGGIGVLAAMATFIVFALLVITCRRCARDGRLKPLAIPAIAYMALAALRGGGVQFGTLCSIWSRRLWNLDPVAIASTAASLGVASTVLWDARRPDRSRRRRFPALAEIPRRSSTD